MFDARRCSTQGCESTQSSAKPDGIRAGGHGVGHVVRGGGILNKARRGELRSRLPVGLSYDARGQVVPNSDKQVQEVLGVFFKTYKRTGFSHGGG